MIRVLVVDDQPMVRMALAALFDGLADFVLMGEASNGEEALALSVRLEPDVVLMDLQMPVMDGITATRRLRETSPHISVLILTSSSDPAQLEAAARVGAYGVVSKFSTREQLVQAMRQAAADSQPQVQRNPIDYASLYAQQGQCYQRRAQLYEAFEALRAKEATFFQTVIEGYNAHTIIITKEDIRAFIKGVRHEHHQIMSELNGVRIELERISTQIPMPAPVLLMSNDYLAS